MAASKDSRLHAYITLCLTTGIRTEEARELRWDHLDLDGHPDADPPIPASAAVWRSVRAHGDVKTEKSRRTLMLSKLAVTALQEHQQTQDEEKRAAGGRWQDSGLVFTTRYGTALDAANVRREFKAVCKLAGIGEDWTPRELRHSFVSLMSASGVPVEEIARIAGHSSSRTTEVVYRRDYGRCLPPGPNSWTRSWAGSSTSGPNLPALAPRNTGPEVRRRHHALAWAIQLSSPARRRCGQYSFLASSVLEKATQTIRLGPRYRRYRPSLACAAK